MTILENPLGKHKRSGNVCHQQGYYLKHTDTSVSLVKIMLVNGTRLQVESLLIRHGDTIEIIFLFWH